MPRPSLKPGELGNIDYIALGEDRLPLTATANRRPAAWRARARYGKFDGSTARKAVTRTTKTAAAQALRNAIAEEITRDREADEDKACSTFAAREWTAAVTGLRAWLTSDHCDLAEATIDAYDDALRLGMLDTSCPFHGRRLDSIRHAELKVWLRSIADKRGNGAAHATKSVASRLFRNALDAGVIDVNPMAGMGEVKRTVRTEERIRKEREAAGKKSTPERQHRRAITPEEYQGLMYVLDAGAKKHPGAGRPRVQHEHVSALVRFMLNTGCRIGEALAVRWEDVDLSSPQPTVTISGTLVPARRGRPLTRQNQTKTATSGRKIALPSEVIDMLRDRQARDQSQGGSEILNSVGVVFPSMAGTLWEPSNARKAVRRVLDDEAAGLDWATPHTFRRTYVTDLLDAGLGVRQVAGAVGHSDIQTTTKFYVDTSTYEPGTAQALERHRSSRKVAT